MPSNTHDDRPARRVGRPREFDRGKALTAALNVFLSRGYLNTSVTDLTTAMGINRPSLYACFGSKQELFKRALHLHAHRHLASLRSALAEPTARKVAERLLRAAMADRKLAGGIGGFMGMLSSLPNDASLSSVREEILAYQNVVLDALRGRFAEAQEAGELPVATAPAAVAFLLEAMSHGISVRAIGGASNEDLEGIVHVALSALCGANAAGLNDMQPPS